MGMIKFFNKSLVGNCSPKKQEKPTSFTIREQAEIKPALILCSRIEKYENCAAHRLALSRNPINFNFPLKPGKFRTLS